jgi:hypothetical protein
MLTPLSKYTTFLVENFYGSPDWSQTEETFHREKLVTLCCAGITLDDAELQSEPWSIIVQLEKPLTLDKVLQAFENDPGVITKSTVVSCQEDFTNMHAYILRAEHWVYLAPGYYEASSDEDKSSGDEDDPREVDTTSGDVDINSIGVGVDVENISPTVSSSIASGDDEEESEDDEDDDDPDYAQPKEE